MRLSYLFVAVIIVSCGQNNSTRQTATDSVKINTDTVHEVVQPPVDSAAIRIAEFEKRLSASSGSNWKVVNDSIAHWPKDVFDYFIKGKRKDNPDYPYIASGDFDGDQKTDTAFLVTNETRTDYQLAISLSSGRIVYWKEDIDLAAITTFSKKELNGWNGEKIKMKADGIEVEYYEKAAFVLYWTGSAFKRVQTAD